MSGVVSAAPHGRVAAQAAPSAPRHAPASIAFVSPSGWGNLGDAAIIDALLQAIRRRLPGARLVGLTQNPLDTARRHGVEAFACAAFSRPNYGVSQRGAERAPAGSRAVSPDDARTGRLGSELGLSMLHAARAVPVAREALTAASLARAVLRHRQLSAERIRGFDFVVVAGGGQMDEFWGGPFGHPYALWEWSLLARRSGARFVVLSVGTGTLTPVGRFFARRALANADFKSFRDDVSRSLLGDPEIAHAASVVPDLAYSLPVAPYRRRRPDSDRPLVAVSPIAYCDPRVWPVRDGARYERHIETMADFVARLSQNWFDVVLFATDGPDNRTLDDLFARIRAKLDAYALTRIRVASITTVAELLDTLADVDAVVASRFHGVLLAHTLGKPAVAVSYERKVATLMQQMGQPELCIDIDAFDADAGWRCFQDLFARRVELTGAIRSAVDGYRAQIERQYDRVFGSEVQTA